MQLNVTGHHVDITPPLRDYVVNKLEKIERHFDLVSDVHCILTVEKLRHKAEATVSVNGGKIYADSTEEDVFELEYAARRIRVKILLLKSSFDGGR